MLTSGLLPTVEISTTPESAYTVIWMHGLGADGNDFIPIVNELKLAPSLGIRFVFPHAPIRPVTINNGYVMRAWYDIYATKIDSTEDEQGIRDTQKAIDALIDHELQHGIPAHHIALAGFSQGGAIALQTGLRQQQKLAGIMALSCYLPLADSLSTEAQPINVTTPILMMHGTYDPVVPLSLAVASKNALSQADYTLEWHEYPMEHSVCAQQITDIDSWLHRIFAPLQTSAT